MDMGWFYTVLVIPLLSIRGTPTPTHFSIMDFLRSFIEDQPIYMARHLTWASHHQHQQNVLEQGRKYLDILPALLFSQYNENGVDSRHCYAPWFASRILSFLEFWFHMLNIASLNPEDFPIHFVWENVFQTGEFTYCLKNTSVNGVVFP